MPPPKSVEDFFAPTTVQKFLSSANTSPNSSPRGNRPGRPRAVPSFAYAPLYNWAKKLSACSTEDGVIDFINDTPTYGSLAEDPSKNLDKFSKSAFIASFGEKYDFPEEKKKRDANDFDKIKKWLLEHSQKTKFSITVNPVNLLPDGRNPRVVLMNEISLTMAVCDNSTLDTNKARFFLASRLLKLSAMTPKRPEFYELIEVNFGISQR